MQKTEAIIRQSVSLPGPIAKRVRSLAHSSKKSSNRVLVELIEAGLETKQAEKKRFFELADRLTESSDPKEKRKLKAELARLTFGA
jgi:hypothetical protein